MNKASDSKENTAGGSEAVAWPYTEPVATLINLGERGVDEDDWPDYRSLGLTEDDLPELIRMAHDEKLYAEDQESNEVWAPAHAWEV